MKPAFFFLPFGCSKTEVLLAWARKTTSAHEQRETRGNENNDEGNEGNQSPSIAKTGTERMSVVLLWKDSEARPRTDLSLRV
mmetsp:Transcript_1258/g.2277  ORF Transcript_1258/g.2277 Transcript_1258/m.2277 type:complete len:82 (-) Transcript_1258:115-360(-)